VWGLTLKPKTYNLKAIMLAIKFKRIGKRGQASFRVIVAEKRSKVDGRFIEDLGWFNPHTSKSKLNVERVNYWIKSGAQPTPSIKNLLKRK